MTKVLPTKGLPVTDGHRGCDTRRAIVLLDHIICFGVVRVQQPQELLRPVRHVAALGAPCDALQFPPQGCPKVTCLARPYCMHVRALGFLALLIKPHLVLDITWPAPQWATPGRRKPTVQGRAMDHAHQHCTCRIYTQLRVWGSHALPSQRCTEACRPLLVCV